MTVYTADDSNRIAYTRALQRASHLTYSQELFVVDRNNIPSQDISRYLSISDNVPTVVHTSTDTIPRVFNFALDPVWGLQWGRDIVAPFLVVTTEQRVTWQGLGASSNIVLEPGDSVRFQKGAYVVAFPTDNMKHDRLNVVQAFDKLYLLQSDVGDSFATPPTTKYQDLVASLFVKAGFPEADDGSGHLSSLFANFPNDWAAKTVPSDVQTPVFPSDDSNNFQYIDIINQLLKTSGCRPLFTDDFGKFTIQSVPKPAQQGPLWEFTRYTTFGDVFDEAVLDDGASHELDLWNVPNQYVFIRTGLTFAPVEGSGQYTINNATTDATHYRYGSDQASIGRIIRTVRRLDAASQADLKTQADQIYSDETANSERITLVTAPWPCAGHFDIFLLYDDTVSQSGVRKLQATSWELPLDGVSNMTWQTRVVADF